MLLDTFTPFQITTPAWARDCFTRAHFHGRFYAGHLVCECGHAR
jgi:hypothetical protein